MLKKHLNSIRTFFTTHHVCRIVIFKAKTVRTPNAVVTCFVSRIMNPVSQMGTCFSIGEPKTAIFLITNWSLFPERGTLVPEWVFRFPE